MLWEFSSQFAGDRAPPSEETASSATVSGTPPKVLPTGLPFAEHEPTAPQVLPTVVMAGDGALVGEPQVAVLVGVTEVVVGGGTAGGEEVTVGAAPTIGKLGTMPRPSKEP